MSDEQEGEILSEGQKATMATAKAVHDVVAHAYLLRAGAGADDLSPYQRHIASASAWESITPILLANLADNVRILRTECDAMLAAGGLRGALDADNEAGIDHFGEQLNVALHELELLNPVSGVEYSGLVAELIERIRTTIPVDPPTHDEGRLPED